MSPKTLTGEELQLDDGPAHESELFLVDGNNLAYRGFFALPEELQTTDGQPTNALLGFTNMLFKLLSDYKPRGVAVAWDTRPVHRTEISAEYKSERRPMPDLLREQFPHFRPIVEAFGYRNLEFEGWEADDVIATLATRADEAGIRTCVVSTDRDAFQLVSENVCLMMTPRGVADVHVYTPERVELRYGVRPDQVPDFIGLKGDTSDNIPGVPGIGDKTAGQLIAQYGSVETVLEHAGELSPARSRSLIEHAEQALASKLLATMRRDLELDIDVDDVVSRPPDRSQLKEIFRRFEFRGLLGRIDTLDDALPAAERPKAESQSVDWREGELPSVRSQVGLALESGRIAIATGEEVVVAPAPSYKLLQGVGASLAVHDAKALRVTAADDTLIAAYLIDPGRAEYLLDDLAAEYGFELEPEPSTEDETATLVRHAEATRRLAPLLRDKVRERGLERLYDEIELPLSTVLAAMEDAGVRIDTYRMGEITARLSDRVEELEARAYELAGEEFVIGSPVQLGRILFEKLELTPGRKGKTGYSTDGKVLRTIRGDHEIVPVVEEWRELTKLVNTYLGPLPTLIGEDGRLHTTINQHVAATGRLSTSSPNLQAIPIRTELGREIRSAFVAEPGHRLAFGGLLADRAQDPRPRVRGAEAARGVPPRRGHPHRDRRRGARQGPGHADEERAGRGQDDQLRHRLRDLRVRALREPRHPEGAGPGVHRCVSRPLPAGAGIHREDDHAGWRGWIRDQPAGAAPTGSRAARVEPANARVRRARRSELRHAGLERGHHQGRDGGHPQSTSSGGTERTARPPGARRASARGAGDRGDRGAGARTRGDGRRIPARPTARGRRRRGRRLGGGEVVTRAPAQA